MKINNNSTSSYTHTRGDVSAYPRSQLVPASIDQVSDCTESEFPKADPINPTQTHLKFSQGNEYHHCNINNSRLSLQVRHELLIIHWRYSLCWDWISMSVGWVYRVCCRKVAFRRVWKVLYRSWNQLETGICGHISVCRLCVRLG